MNHKQRQTFRVVVRLYPIVHRARDCVIVRCDGTAWCPEPRCGRILFMLARESLAKLAGNPVTRECRVKKSVLCEVELGGSRR